ncbi:MAG: hypothetical protein RBJ76_14220 [Stenomitos frigidus ULC029]
MVQDFTSFRKISFQTVDVEVALAEIEYQYLKFICEATLRNSDEVLREQIRHLHIAGLPSFDDWRKQGANQGLFLPAIETSTISTTAIESNDSTADTLVQPQSNAVSDRTEAEPLVREASPAKAKPTETKLPQSKATGTLLQSLSEPATAKLTSREVIEQQHEQLTVLLKEGKTMDDLAILLTSNGAKISASTLRNYLSAARRKAKTGKATAANKITGAVSKPSATAERSPDTTDSSEEPAPPSSAPPSIEATTGEPIVPPKPARGRPKAAAKATLERETSVTSRPRKQPSPLDVSPVPRRRKNRI